MKDITIRIQQKIDDHCFHIYHIKPDKLYLGNEEYRQLLKWAKRAIKMYNTDNISRLVSINRIELSSRKLNFFDSLEIIRVKRKSYLAVGI